MDGSILLGPWGGNGGDEWDDGVHIGVREITLIYGSCIDSIRVTYDNYGKPFWLKNMVASVEPNRLRYHTFSLILHIKLQFQNGILVSVSGHYCPVVYGGSPVIRSLTFKSNKRTFGPFGIEEGILFNFFTNGGHIVGFNGKSRWFLDSLGFYLSSYSSPKQNLFQRFQIMYKGFNPLAIKDGEHNKIKGSKGHWWGI
ncbi:putative jacalin-like lectin domain-containing protein [Helianthus anomalus]